MHSASAYRKLFRKPFNSKGVSSVIGAVFMILIVGTLASAYFFYTLNENTIYNQAVRAQNDYELARMSEALQISSTVYRIDQGTVTINAKIFNTGAYSVNITTLWLKVSGDINNSNYTKVNTVVKVGEVIQLSVQLKISGVVQGGNYNFASWAVSSRGNTYALESLRTNSVIVAQTSQGIGSLSMDFNNFTYYQIKSTGTGGYKVDFSTGTNAYNIAKVKAPIAICVNFTNYDVTARDIILNQNSELFSIFPSTGGNYKAVTWYVIRVNLITGELQPFTGKYLNYTVPTQVFFGARDPGSINSFVSENDMFTGVCPVNLALTGTIGNSPFGQNIPFVSIYIT